MNTERLAHSNQKTMDIGITVVSPIHVGGAQEKHLKNGLDYIGDKENKLIRIVNWEETIGANHKERSSIMSDLQNGRVGANRKYALQFEAAYHYEGREAGDMRRLIRSGLGVPYLPGSSIKGSLRSIALEAYDTSKSAQQPRIKANNLEDQHVGIFHKSLFSLLQVRDVDFRDDVFLCNSKIYNVNQQKEGAWKNRMGRNQGNEPNFQEGGFATMAESLRPGAGSEGQLIFKLPPSARTEMMSRVNQAILKDSWQEDPFLWMENTAKAYMQRYLEAEVAYFKRFYGAQHREAVVDAFTDLQDYHSRLPAGSFLIRLGWGSGFHQMTGDWQFPDHLKRVEQHMKQKSRKLAFWRENGELRFAPMGFAVISRKGTPIEAPPFAVKAQSVSENELQTEEPAKPFSPEWQDAAKVKHGNVVDARVIGTQGKQVVVQVYIKGYENQEYKFTYHAGIDEGKYIKVRVQYIRRKIEQGFNLQFVKMTE